MILFAKVLGDDSKWWKVKVGPNTGYAAKFNFALRDIPFKYGLEPWYFDELTETEAEDLLKEGIQAGTWVILENCHLVPEWLSILESICEGFDKTVTFYFSLGVNDDHVKHCCRQIRRRKEEMCQR